MAKAKAKKKTKAKVQAKLKGKPKVKVKAKTKPKVRAVARIAKTKPVAVKSAIKIKSLDVSAFVTPLDDRMIVQVFAGERVTAGGLIIPDTVSISGNREGVVLSVGQGHRDAKGRFRPMDVKKGDKVIFSEHTGSKINYQGHDLIILRETDVMGVLN